MRQDPVLQTGVGFIESQHWEQKVVTIPTLSSLAAPGLWYSLRQTPVPPVTTKMASWHLSFQRLSTFSFHIGVHANRNFISWVPNLAKCGWQIASCVHPFVYHVGDNGLCMIRRWHENTLHITGLLCGESPIDSLHKGPVMQNYKDFFVVSLKII